METETLERFLKIRNVAVRWIIGIVSVLAALLVLLNIARIGTAYWFYSDVFQWVTVNLGLDKYMAMTAATIVTTALLFALPWFGWVFLFGKRRTYAIIAISASICAVGIVTQFAGKDVNFDRRNGKALKYYAMTPEGAVYSFTPGFDPKYGAAYKPLTQQAVNNLNASNGQSDATGATLPESGPALPEYGVALNSKISVLQGGAILTFEGVNYTENGLMWHLKFNICDQGEHQYATPSPKLELRFRKSEQAPILAMWNLSRDWRQSAERSGARKLDTDKACYIYTYNLAAIGKPPGSRYTFEQGLFEIDDGDGWRQALRINSNQSTRTNL